MSTMPPLPLGPRGLPHKTAEYVRKLVKAGETDMDIAVELGIAADIVFRIRRNLNESRRRARRLREAGSP